MAGFPKDGNYFEIGHDHMNLPVPFPCLRAAINNEGPGRNKRRQIESLPGKPERVE
jgi:hypothetical protein